MSLVFTERRYHGQSGGYISPEGCSVNAGGITISALPPGKVDIDISFDDPTINIVPSGTLGPFRFRHNGTRREPATLIHNGVAFYGGKSDLLLEGENPDWEILMEFGGDSLARIASESMEAVALDQIEFADAVEPSSAILAQMAIAHLREPAADRLYLEGLAIAMTARTLAFAAPGRAAPSTRGTDARIARATEYLHAHLTEGLTVEELAGVACMSPSWFSRAFKAQTGMSVHVYVLEQRLERARVTLTLTNEPVGTIAHACGFADHSHLTRLFRRRYGVTPSGIRG